LASAAVDARIGNTLVDVGLAFIAGVARSANTSVGVEMIRAGCAVLAWRRRTIVKVGLTVVTHVSGRAGAIVIIDVIDAC